MYPDEVPWQRQGHEYRVWCCRYPVIMPIRGEYGTACTVILICRARGTYCEQIGTHAEICIVASLVLVLQSDIRCININLRRIAIELKRDMLMA
eukprot:scaffold10715_cov96-Skeletonema_marinoi.AAC.2